MCVPGLYFLYVFARKLQSIENTNKDALSWLRLLATVGGGGGLEGLELRLEKMGVGFAISKLAGGGGGSWMLKEGLP